VDRTPCAAGVTQRKRNPKINFPVFCALSKQFTPLKNGPNLPHSFHGQAQNEVTKKPSIERLRCRTSESSNLIQRIRYYHLENSSTQHPDQKMDVLSVPLTKAERLMIIILLEKFAERMEHVAPNQKAEAEALILKLSGEK
jgi:hypothetical protein